MKKLIMAALAAFIPLFAPAQNYNITLASHMSYGSTPLANIGGYTDSLNNEYALVGTGLGLSIVNVTAPASPVQSYMVPGAMSDWREIKTYRHYAYVTNEGDSGLQIIDLSPLPGAPIHHQYYGDGTIAGQLITIHALHCDTLRGYLYLYGSNIDDGEALFLDLNADPYHPHYVGRFTYPGGGNPAYIHDGYVENDTAYFCHIYGGFFTVVDVRNKTSPVLLATQNTPGAFTHNCWISGDHHTLFTTDEVTNSYLTSYDITNLSNITELARFQTDPGSNSIVHNTHILNGYAITSWYTQGVVITDVSRPSNIIEVGKYDTYTASNGGTFNGDWGVYPYLPSGNLVASDINNGLYVLTPSYVRACYLEGTVTDSATAALLQGVTMQIATVSNSTRITGLTGQYRTGSAVAGTFNVTFSKPGYYSKTITGVSLAHGTLTTLNVQLRCISCTSFFGQVIEAGTGNPVANASVLISSSGGSEKMTTDASGNFSLANTITGVYNITAGEWGYVTNCHLDTINPAASPMTITLDKGYYDDFSFDFNWTKGVATHNWERAIPSATYDGSAVANPGNDVSVDCLNYCYVTDNGGGGPFDHDVDPADGKVTLTSPVFDLSAYSLPALHYYRWFYDANNTNGPPNDTMQVSVTNGVSTVILETILHNTAGNGTWVSKTWNLRSLIPLTASMHLILKIADATPGNVVEGGLDEFRITENGLGIEELSSAIRVQADPNPAEHEFKISYDLHGSRTGCLVIRDVTGREVEKIRLNSPAGNITAGLRLGPGIYFLTVTNENNLGQTLKAVKTW